MKNKILLITLISLIFGTTSNWAQTTGGDVPYGLEKPLFQVKNRDQQTVFAVYPSGVKIYIDDKLKAAGGGFTVGRLGTGKNTGTDFFIVRPNDVKVILNETTEKAAGGGFTVGRLGTGKSTGDVEFLSVTPDQTRISVNDSVAGFAITNNVNGTSENILYLNKQNYFIGHNTGTQITSGIYNSAFGYQAGKNLSTGKNNLFLGYQSGFLNQQGNDNVYLGNRTAFFRESGHDNICIGNKAGENSVFASYSTYIGSEAGRNLTGEGNIIIGDRSGSVSFSGSFQATANTIVGVDAGRNVGGDKNTYLGSGAGTFWTQEGGNLNNPVPGMNNVFVGYEAGGGSGQNKLGDNNVCIGFQAGLNQSGSNKLFIANSDTDNPLIYGEFDNSKLFVNGNLTVTGDLAVSSNLSLSNNLTVNNDLSVIKDLEVGGDLSVNTNLQVYGDLVVKTNMNVKSNLLVNNDLSVTNTLYTNNLTVTGEFSSPSDLRLKTNFVQFTSGLELVKKLNAYYYDWNTEAKQNFGFSDKKQIGLIAQEVENILPELVNDNFNGYKTIDYVKVIPVLINAINEQQSEIEKLKADLSEMESIVKKMSEK